MLRVMLAIAALSLFVLASALPDAALAADAEFSALDHDKDGKVSHEEFLRWYPVKVWKKADADGDGYVQETEWVPVRESISHYKSQEARDAEVKQ